MDKQMMTPVYTAEVIQFMRPNGHKRRQYVELPIETQELYSQMVDSGCRFEAEVLTTGEVSVTISDNDKDVDINVSSDGPCVLSGMIDMLNRQQWLREDE